MSSIESALQLFTEAWSGRHVAPQPAAVAYCALGAPLELVQAAGLSSRRLFPDPTSDTPLADISMEEIFDGAIRSLYERALRGDCQATGLLLIPRFSEGYLQLYYYLQESLRWQPAPSLPPLHLFDLLKSPNWSTRCYVKSQLLTLRETLQTLAGRPITDADLAQAIKQSNQQRRLMQQVDELRHCQPSRLTGSDWMRITATAGLLPIDDHIQALEHLLAAASDLPALNGPRVLIKGSPLDDLGLYEVIESLGGCVVADDHGSGNSLFHGAIDEHQPSMDALAQYYHRDLPTLRTLPATRDDERLLNLVQRSGAQAVVFYFEENDDTLGWDYPRQKRLLDAQGIASICLLDQSWRQPDRPVQRAQLQAWLHSVPTSPHACPQELA